jgi:hypothetical protein
MYDNIDKAVQIAVEKFREKKRGTADSLLGAIIWDDNTDLDEFIFRNRMADYESLD